MAKEEQLNLYEEENHTPEKKEEGVDGLESSAFKKTAEQEAGTGGRYKGVFSSGLIAKLIIEYNSKSKIKISLEDPREWIKVVGKLKDFGFHVDEVEMNKYIDGLKKDRSKKAAAEIKELKKRNRRSIEMGLPSGDKD